MTRALRAAAVGVFVAVALAVPVAVFRAVEAFGTPEVEVGLDVIDPIEAALAEMRAEAGDRPQIAFLGDSMVISYPEGRTIPDRLQQTLDDLPGGPRVRVRPIAQPGMGPFDFYFLADRVADAGPDLVVVPFNLGSFADAWRGTFSRPELSGWLPAARILQALRLPLDWIGLTVDRLLAYQTVVKVGATKPWHAFVKEQARVGRARHDLAWWLGKTLGDGADARFAREGFVHAARKLRSKKTHRLTAKGVEERFGVVLDGIETDDPELQLLAAMVRIFDERGIPVLVYVDPFNVTHLAHVGMAGGPGLGHTLAAIESVARRAGADFADLHASLPDEAFRDAAGHLAFAPGTPDGPLRVGQLLAPIVASRIGLPQAPEATDTTDATDAMRGRLMLFNSFQFAFFFAVVWLLHRSLPAAWRNPLLLVASLLFYSLWLPVYLLLLLFEIAASYALIRVIASGRGRRTALTATAVLTLGLLAGFKYAALAVETVAPLLHAGFGVSLPVPDIFLPLGISFFSFQILGLAIDVYRGDCEPPPTLARHALFVSFFPQLIAGPICAAPSSCRSWHGVRDPPRAHPARPLAAG